ncbi:MFS transporter, partial [Streptomyces griseoviridis]
RTGVSGGEVAAGGARERRVDRHRARVLDRAYMHPANARIAGAFSLADTAGTYGGTLVVGLVGAVRALWLDSLSYLVSAWCASWIRPGAPRRAAGDRPVRMGAAIREGVRYVMRDPIQRPLVLSLASLAFADGIVTTFFAYTLLTRLDSGSTGLGLVMGVVAAGGLAGAVVATRLVDRFGPAHVMLSGFLSYAVCGVPLLVARPEPVWLGVIAAADAPRTAAAVAAGTTQRSLRQQLCPPSGAAVPRAADLHLADHRTAPGRCPDGRRHRRLLRACRADRRDRVLPRAGSTPVGLAGPPPHHHARCRAHSREGLRSWLLTCTR